MGQLLKTIGGTVAGVVLLLMLCVGLVQYAVFNPYPPIPSEALAVQHFGRTEKGKLEDLNRLSGESASAYHRRLVAGVNSHMVHYWPEESRSATQVSPFTNYLLWALSFVPGYEHFGSYEYVSPQLAWDRGYGFCSQVSRVIYSVLREQGLDATVMQHPNHVVVEADGHVLDADYGVYIPYSLADVQANPKLVAEYYAQFPTMVPLLSQIYRDGWTETASKEQFDYMLNFERKAELFKWVLLLVSLSLSVCAFSLGSYRQHKSMA